jgi:CDGSH-type Zn-finger protein
MNRKTTDSGARIKVTRDGPYIVTGRVPLSEQIIVVDSGGDAVAWREGRRFPEQETYALCRCGRSGTMPFCDGTHARIGFKVVETASRAPYIEQARVIEGPGLKLTDAEALCASARFCKRAGGVHRLTLRSSRPEAKQLAIEESVLCPAGRLVAWTKENDAIEPDLVPSIGLVEDPQAGVSGPTWVRGGIPIESADGTLWETRNRVTLCRCGRSANEPFCDGTHIEVRFNDGTTET